jgi:hypothetical protein
LLVLQHLPKVEAEAAVRVALLFRQLETEKTDYHHQFQVALSLMQVAVVVAMAQLEAQAAQAAEVLEAMDLQVVPEQ